MKRSSKRQKSTIQTTKPKAKNSSKKNGSYLLYGLLAGIITFFVNYLFFANDGDTIFIISKGIIILTSLVLSSVIFYSIFKIEEKQTANISKYTFLIMLLYSIGVSLIPLNEYSNEFIKLYQKLTTFQSILIIPTIVLGVISVWIHKEKLQELINDLYAEKEVPEEKTSIKDRILNPIKQLFSKKEILSTSLLFVIIGISIFTLFYRLDYFDLYSDEATSMQGATSYYHTGEYKEWNFVTEKPSENNYNRAWPHQFIVAQSYKLFGISTWSSRFPSAVFGVLLILLSYFVGRYFIKDKWAVLLVIFSFAFFIEFLFLQRWTRMYAMLLPIFMIEFLLFYKFVAEKNTCKYIRIKRNTIFDNYLNFNYIYLIPLLLLIVLSYNIHINSTLIFPVILLFVIFTFFITKEKKYIVVAAIGVLILTIVIFSPYKVYFNQFSFFEVKNFNYYLNAFFGYPVRTNTNIIVLIIVFTSLLFIKNSKYKLSYLMLYVSSLMGLVLFAFILMRYVAFKYMSFAAPFSILLIIGAYFLIFRTLFNKKLLFLLSVLIISSIAIHFNRIYDDIYVRNFASPAKPSVAWKDIVENYKEGEVIGRHWGPGFYFSGLNHNAKFFSLGHYTGNSFVSTYDTIRSYKSGWLTWHTQFSRIIDNTLMEYASMYMKKLHGHGIDETGVEVYHFVDSLLADTIKFKTDKLIPNANLNLNNAYSITFWLKTTDETEGKPFIFTDGYKEILNLSFANNITKNLLFKYNNTGDSVKIGINADSQWHHIVWYQSGGNVNNEFGLYIDGQLTRSKKKSDLTQNIIKFKVNPYFNGVIDDIRIYKFVLEKPQISAIMAVQKKKKTEKLSADNKIFETLYLWQKSN